MKPYYQDEFATIYHGDCREVLPQLEPVDLVLTDPPYGINADVEQNKRANKQYGNACAPSAMYIKTEWDCKTPSPATLRLILEQSNAVIIWGGQYLALPQNPGWLVWDKVTGGNKYADCELAWTSFLGTVRKFTYLWNGMLQQDMKRKEVRSHPTQKPLPLMKWCISLAPKAKTILDPFMGSGTTLRAAKDLGLKSIGIELEEKYCEIAAKRLQQEVLWSAMAEGVAA